MSRLPSFLAALALTSIAEGAGAGEPLRGEALLQAAEARYALADLEEAARDWESFARAEIHDTRSPEVLRRAMAARILVGQDAEAAVDAAEIQRAWARKYPVFVASAQLALATSRAARGAWDDAIASLGEATRALSAGDGIESRVQVQSLLGRSFAALGRTREAITAHRSALAQASRQKALPRRGASGWAEPARDALAESRFFFAERERLRAEGVTLPPYRGSGDRATLLAYYTTDVGPWTVRRSEAIEDATRAYQSVLGVEVPRPPPRRWSASGGDPNAPRSAWGRDDSLGADETELPSIRWAIAAADRVGWMWADYVHIVRTLPIPTTWPASPGVHGEYRMQLDPGDAPYFESARRAFKYCLELSRKYRIFDEHTRSCEAWFGRYRRGELVAFDEFFPSPTWAGPALIPAPIRHDP